jgi:hypothetical protein
MHIHHAPTRHATSSFDCRLYSSTSSALMSTTSCKGVKPWDLQMDARLRAIECHHSCNHVQTFMRSATRLVRNFPLYKRLASKICRPTSFANWKGGFHNSQGQRLVHHREEAHEDRMASQHANILQIHR